MTYEEMCESYRSNQRVLEALRREEQRGIELRKFVMERINKLKVQAYENGWDMPR